MPATVRIDAASANANDGSINVQVSILENGNVIGQHSLNILSREDLVKKCRDLLVLDRSVRDATALAAGITGKTFPI